MILRKKQAVIYCTDFADKILREGEKFSAKIQCGRLAT